MTTFAFICLTLSLLFWQSQGQQGQQFRQSASLISCPTNVFVHRRTHNFNITCVINTNDPDVLLRWHSANTDKSSFSILQNSKAENGRIVFPPVAVINNSYIEATLIFRSIESPSDYRRTYTLKMSGESGEVTMIERGRGANSVDWWDYLVFAIILSVSAGIGLYHGFFSKKEVSQAEYMLGGRTMSWLPVSLSLLASFMSAITLLGTPSEIFTFGTQYIVIAFSYPFVMIASCYVFLPVFYRLKLTSAYEYLELRFSKVVRIAGAVLFTIQMVLYMAMVIFAPSIALQAVIGVNFWVSALSTAFVCIFYTAMGGMRATMWTDAFQVMIMYIGLVAIFVIGCMREGGFSYAWNRAVERGRVEFFQWNPDPRIRHSAWTVFIGSIFTWLYTYGVNQAQVQRGLSCRSMKDLRIAFWLNVPGLIMMMLLPALCGILVFSRYADCDPMKAGLITKRDQLLIYYVVDIVAEDFPGLPGLFMASLFAAALSTISSGINGLAAVTCRDFGIERWLTSKGWSDRKITAIAKMISALYGVICILLMFPIQYLPGLLDSALGLFGSLGGPLLGTFMCGLLVPWINGIGAMAGLVVSAVVTNWMTFGAKASPHVGSSQRLPSSSTLACDAETFAHSSAFTPSFTEERPLNVEQLSGLDSFYAISYLYLSIVGIVLAFAVGTLVSAATGWRKLQDYSKEERRLIHPMILSFGKRFYAKSQHKEKNEDIDDFEEPTTSSYPESKF